MKPEELNPKAREAFGKSLIDIGVAIFKALMLLITVVPLAALLKAMFVEPTTTISWGSILAPFSGLSGLLIIIFLGASFLLGAHLRQEGIRHIHEIEEEGKDNEET